MKKITNILLIVTLVLMLIPTSAIAEIPPQNYEEIFVINDGFRVDFPDQKPYIDSNARTMVPVRFVSETLGSTVYWDQNTRSVIITTEDHRIVLQIGNNTYTKNDLPYTMDTSPVITNERTMVPVRFVAEALGAQVRWEVVDNKGIVFNFTKGQDETEIQQIINQVKNAIFNKEDILVKPMEGFDFNGRYYPSFYWMGETVGKARESYKNRLTGPVHWEKGVTFIEEHQDNDEMVWKIVTSKIVEKYPILFEGTKEEITANQIEQLFEVAEWFRDNTFYLNTTTERENTYGHRMIDAARMDYIYNLYGSSVHGGQYYLGENTPYKFENGYSEEFTKNTDIGVKAKEARTNSVKIAEPLGMFYGVCYDYAGLFKAVLNQLGIDSEVITSMDANHAWNAVRLYNGDIYYFDMTQADEDMAGLFMRLFIEQKGSHMRSKYGSPDINNKFEDIRVTENRLISYLNNDIIPVGKLPSDEIFARALRFLGLVYTDGLYVNVGRDRVDDFSWD